MTHFNMKKNIRLRITEAQQSRLLQEGDPKKEHFIKTSMKYLESGDIKNINMVLFEAKKLGVTDSVEELFMKRNGILFQNMDMYSDANDFKSKIFSLLKQTSLSFQDVTHIPEMIGNLPNLEILQIMLSNIQSLPESIGNLKNLNILNLSRNRLTSLPESIGNLSKLERLYLSKNRLTSLPESINKMSSLRYLAVEGNPMKILPTLPVSLEVLSADNNQFQAKVLSTIRTYLPQIKVT